MFRFDFQPIGGFYLFVTVHSHFLLSGRLLPFNNVMITRTSARWSARIVELVSGKFGHTFANSVNPDKTVPYERSHQDFHCLLS